MSSIKPHFISIVSPVYQGAGIVAELVKRISEEVIKVTDNYEIILVEDASPDNSWEEIEKACCKNPRVKGVKLSKNFGQQNAISAGLQYSTGDFVVVMDCDLQDNPRYILDLYEKALLGNDIVYTRKNDRKHNIVKNIFAGIYFKVINYLSDNSSADNKTGAYTMLSRKVVNAFCKIKDHHRHYLMILKLLGFQSTYINIVHEERFEGKSSYNFFKLFN